MGFRTYTAFLRFGFALNRTVLQAFTLIGGYAGATEGLLQDVGFEGFAYWWLHAVDRRECHMPNLSYK